MALILCIDTATDVCSIALFSGNTLIALESSHKKNSHAELIAVFTEEILKKNNYTFNDLHAVAVSKGPGSYTGLRIGVSYAKGLCYGLQVPLISYPTLQSIAMEFLQKNIPAANAILCPMIDARRMEAYYALFDEKGEYVKQEAAIIGDENIFAEYKDKEFYYFGSGAAKFEQLLPTKNFHFIPGIESSPSNIGNLLWKKYENKQFEDTAYFEPFYLKEFYTR